MPVAEEKIILSIIKKGLLIMGSGKDFDTKIYFITDSTGFAEDEFMWRIESALQGGVNIMQLREKNRTTREYILLADKVHIIAKKI